jgi:hypothetical protein
MSRAKVHAGQQHLKNAGSSAPTRPHTHPPRHPPTHPPFFSTGLLHLGQGLVLALSQLEVSLPSFMRRSQSRSMSQVAGLCCTSQQAKQNLWPHAQSTCGSPASGGEQAGRQVGWMSQAECASGWAAA